MAPRPRRRNLGRAGQRDTAGVLDRLCGCLSEDFDVELGTFQLETHDRRRVEQASHPQASSARPTYSHRGAQGVALRRRKLRRGLHEVILELLDREFPACAGDDVPLGVDEHEVWEEREAVGGRCAVH